MYSRLQLLHLACCQANALPQLMLAGVFIPYPGAHVTSVIPAPYSLLCTQWPAKRLLHLLGEMEGEYQPFVRYGSGPLLAALLEAQGVPPGPLLARRVDAHILLGLEDQHLRTQLGLDEVQVIKVGRGGGGGRGPAVWGTWVRCVGCEAKGKGAAGTGIAP